MTVRAWRVLLGLGLLLAPGRGAASLFSDTPESFGPSDRTSAVALGDLDGDGDLDLVAGTLNGLSLRYANAFPDLPPYANPVFLNGNSSLLTLSVAVGDVDGDALLDIVLGNPGGIAIYPGRGGVIELPPAASVYSQVLGDMDGDGDLDIVTGGAEADMLFRNDGAGGFAPPDSFALDLRTQAIAVGDVDGDGDLDVVCGNETLANSLHRNDGGSFVSLPFGSFLRQTRCVALGDLDGDGDLDLVCGREAGDGTASAEWYRNTGGAFTFAQGFGRAFLRVAGVALGDVDGDGDLDVALGVDGSFTGFPARSAVHLNAGGSILPAPAWESRPGEQTHAVALADVDGDGDFDLVCGNDGVDTIYWNERAPFASAPSLTFGSDDTRALGLGDVDGDGDLDIVAGNHGASTLYRNDGGAYSLVWSSPADSTNSVALGDVNGDGRLDLVCGNGEENRERPTTLFPGTNGIFAANPSWSSPPRVTNGVALADVNGDGRPDLVRGNGNGLIGQANTLYLSRNGTFSDAADWTSEFEEVTLSVTLGDVDGDGRSDLLFGTDGLLAAELGRPEGGFARGWESPTNHPNFFFSVALGDMDADGDLDLMAANLLSGGTGWANATGDFGLSPVWSSGGDTASTSLALGDVDGDGDLDAVFGNFNHASTLYLNGGGRLATQPSWSTAQPQLTHAVALGDLDQDGDLDLVLGNGGVDYDNPDIASRSMVNTIFLGLANPPLTGGLASPRNQLPNNSPFITSVQTDSTGPNERRVRFILHDAESDPASVVVDYQFEGDPSWVRMDLAPQIALSSSPPGVAHTFTWDIARFPSDRRQVNLRLRTVALPRRVSLIQHASAYIEPMGRVVPIRPELSLSAPVLAFPGPITLGDTSTVGLVIQNRGNADLRLEGADLALGMRVDTSFPAVLRPGETDTLRFSLAPRTLAPTGSVTLHTNDPFSPEVPLPVSAEVLPVAIASTRLVFPAPASPLGEAMPILVTPASRVRVERGVLYYKPGRGPATFDSLALAPIEGSFIAVIPASAVTERGVAYYAAMENSGFRAVDPPRAPSVPVYFQGVDPPAEVAALPLFNAGGSTFLEGRDVQVQVALPAGAVFVSGRLHFRRGGDFGYGSVDVTPAEPLPSATIPASAVGPRGVAYWVEIETATTTLTDPPQVPEERPRSLEVTTLDLVEPASHPARQYRLLSIPLDTEGTVLETLTDDLGSPDPARWRLFAYDTGVGYTELPAAERCCFEPGRAYWLITADPHQVGTGPARGLSLPAASAFSILLAPQHNLVGHPFAFSVAWDACFVIRGSDTLSTSDAKALGLLEPPVSWMGNRYALDTPILEPFSGYWVKNLTEGNLVLLVPPTEVLLLSQAPMPTEEAAPVGWELRIDATGPAGSASEIRVGMRPGAQDAWDPTDRSEPPMPPGQAISLFVPHFSWGTHPGAYALDMRSPEISPRSAEAALTGEPLSRGQAWALDVAKNFTLDAAGDELTLDIAGIEAAPSDLEITLVDRNLERTIDLRREHRLVFFLSERAPSRDEGARFLLLVGERGFADSWREGLSAGPVRSALYAVHPNPLRGAARVRFDLDRTGPAALHIYDARGSLVRVLAEREFEAGRYELEWNGADDAGEHMAGGVYFVRLTQGRFTQSRKLILLP